MATTTTTIALTGRNFPLIGLTGYGYPSNAIPRSELLFDGAANAITVAAAGEDQIVSITMSLPRGYAYVLLEATLRIYGADVADWDDCAGAELQDSDVSPQFLAHMSFCNPGGEVAHSAGGVALKTYQVERPIQKVILCDRPGNGRLWVSCMNTTIDGVVMNCNMYARFARYDLEQARYFAVSAAVPVR